MTYNSSLLRLLDERGYIHQVTDAAGIAVLKKELGDGETASAAGALPLAVVVGRADMTTVEVRGKPMDLAPLAKNNVARFEVKE